MAARQSRPSTVSAPTPKSPPVRDGQADRTPQAFVVMGAGAVGCWVGGMLARAGHHVVFVGRGGTLAALRRDGLSLSDLDGLRVRVAPQDLQLAESAAQAAQGAQGAHGAVAPIVLLCVKGRDTRDAARALGAVFPPGTPVVSLQNGVDNPDRIRDGAPSLQAIAGMVPFNVARSAPGAFHRATSGEIVVQGAPAARRLADALVAAGVAARIADDLAPVQWGKVLLNLNNPVNALVGRPLREQLADRDARRVLALLQDEALDAMRAAGIRPAAIAGVPPAWLPRILRLPNALYGLAARRSLRIDPHARSSMLDDLEAGRPTEVDDLCGAVVRLAQAHGRDAPANRAMVGLIEEAGRGTRWDGKALLERLQGRSRTS